MPHCSFEMLAAPHALLRSVAHHAVHADGEPDGVEKVSVHPIDRQVNAGPALAVDRKTSRRAEVRFGAAELRGVLYVETGHHPGRYL